MYHFFFGTLYNQNKFSHNNERYFEVLDEEDDQLFANSHSCGPLSYWPYVRAVAQKK